jgi:hypothetical protein
MKVSTDNLNVLFLQIHKAIEETADKAATSLTNHSADELISYPPNGGLNEIESESLKTIKTDDNVKSGLRKVIADSCATVVFDILANIDGVSDPVTDFEKWKGIKLVDDSDEIEAPDDLMLHDKLYDSYWAWRKRRENKEWKLDNYVE